MSDKLPTPATAMEMYAAAIVAELRTLNAQLSKINQTFEGVSVVEEPAPDQPVEVELKEPAKKASHRDAKKAEAATRTGE